MQYLCSCSVNQKLFQQPINQFPGHVRQNGERRMSRALPTPRHKMCSRGTVSPHTLLFSIQNTKFILLWWIRTVLTWDKMIKMIAVRSVRKVRPSLVRHHLVCCQRHCSVGVGIISSCNILRFYQHHIWCQQLPHTIYMYI